MGEKIQTTSPLKARIRFTPKIRHTPREGKSHPKLFKELRNLKFWIFANFISFSLTWAKKFQTTPPMKVCTRFAPQNSCIPLGSLYQSC